MNLQSNALVAAIAAMSWAFAPAALSQEPDEELPPSSSAEQSSAADDLDSPSATELDEEAAAAQETMPAESAAAPAIDDKKIEQFADAYVEVQTIQQKASADLAEGAGHGGR